MNERETSSFTTSKGNILVVKTYLTGRELREIQHPYFRQAENFTAQEVNEKGLSGSRYEASQNTGFKIVVVSINGNKDGDMVDGVKFSVVDFILDLPSTEFNEIVKGTDAIIKDGKNTEEKKTL